LVNIYQEDKSDDINIDNDVSSEEDENQEDKSDDININKINNSTINRDSSIDKPKEDRRQIDKVTDINVENLNFETQLNGEKTDISDKSKNNQNEEFKIEDSSASNDSTTNEVIDTNEKKTFN
jgi:hypothetical protein